MCGIASIAKKQSSTIHKVHLEKMRDLASHRGPDGAGTQLFDSALQPVQSDQNWIIGLAHRRLSIIDVSNAGHQPMTYENDYWISFNGEIYNYIELKKRASSTWASFLYAV